MRTCHLSWLICLGLSGCMLGPDYQRPATDTPAAGTWCYWVVAMNGSSVASLPAGPVTITI